MIVGLNMYKIIAVLAGGILLLHFTSQEEMIIAILAVVAITYMTKGR